jgi:hypothetical protein
MLRGTVDCSAVVTEELCCVKDILALALTRCLRLSHGTGVRLHDLGAAVYMSLTRSCCQRLVGQVICAAISHQTASRIV